MSRATISDVARKAGVGIATVSRVLNNAPFVKETTARSVRKVIAEMGYAPASGDHQRGPRKSREARGLRNSLEADVDSKVVVIILGSHRLRWILDYSPIYSYVLSGIESAFNKRGRSLTVRQASDWDSLLNVIKQDSAKGIILFGPAEPEGVYPSIIEKIPSVWVVGNPRRYRGDHVTCDHFRIGEIAAEYAIEHGHHLCAYLGPATGSMPFFAGYRADTFCSQILAAGGSVLMLLDTAITVVSETMNAPNEPVLSVMIDRLLAAAPRPSLLMLHSDMYAPSVYRLLLERGIQPGKDITILSCNNERPYLVGLLPAPVVIDAHGEDIGLRAVDQLMWRIENPDAGAVRLMVEPQLVVPK
jgi:LacI family transcriptional regulator